jgi:hypothetical protein
METPVLKLFNFDLHVSVIADVKDIVARLYGSRVIIDNISISGHSWVFGKESGNMDIVNQKTWTRINADMINMFVERYREKLLTYDGFIVTHTPVFACLYEAFGKPIIVVNSCRYDQPYCMTYKIKEWGELNERLQRLTDKGLIHIISNNKADQEYLRMATGLISVHIPSLCLYTHSSHDYTAAMSQPPILYSGEHSLLPYSHIGHRPHQFKWEELFNAKGLVHIPYEVSTMSIFEQYSAGVPLYFPTKRLLLELITSKQTNLQSSYWHWRRAPVPSVFVSTSDPAWWLERADYYDSENMPGVRFFDCLEDLRNPDFFDITEDDWVAHIQNIEQRKMRILALWRTIFENAFPSLTSSPTAHIA